MSSFPPIPDVPPIMQRQRLVITGLHRMDYIPFSGTALTQNRKQIRVLFRTSS
jgi:hypothetical protein